MYCSGFCSVARSISFRLVLACLRNKRNKASVFLLNFLSSDGWWGLSEGYQREATTNRLLELDMRDDEERSPESSEPGPSFEESDLDGSQDSGSILDRYNPFRRNQGPSDSAEDEATDAKEQTAEPHSDVRIVDDVPPVAEPDQGQGSTDPREPSLGPEPNDHGDYPLPEDETTSQSASVELLLDRSHTLENAFGALRGEIESKALEDNSREDTIDRLHAEVQEYKRGLLDQALDPIIRGLIQIHDHMGRSTYGTSTSASADLPLETLELLGNFRTELEDLLMIHGVDAFEEKGNVFIAGRQRALRTTEEPPSAESAGMISRRVLKGFEKNGVVLRPENVELFAKLTEPEAEVEDNG